MDASAVPSTTGSMTIADLLLRAAERYGDAVAALEKVDGSWTERTYAQVGEAVSEIGRGLIDLGLQPGERVALLANTRLEWTLVDFAISSAGGVVVPVYATNSPEECEWVAGDSESAIVVCEDAAQLAKIDAVRERLPALRDVVVIDAAGDVGDAISLDELRERGRRRDEAELRERAAAVGPDDPYTFMYTSGTTGPPKGCVLTHGNYRSVLDQIGEIGVLVADEPQTVYLFLPLAHAFALLVQLQVFDSGHRIAYFGGDPKQIIPELTEVKPTFLPSIPRIFEKLYTLVSGMGDAEKLAGAVAVGTAVRGLQEAGQEVPAELAAAFEQAEEALFSKVRGAFGGNLHQAVTGAAPISPRILEFFWACGVPVMEGFGMTETATVATLSTPLHHRFGTVGRAIPGVELRIAEDGEVLIKGPNVFQGYHRNDDASFGAIVDGWLHTGDLGSIDEDGYLSITGRKKDIIITAGGKNLTPANLENDLKSSRWISQAVMHGDRRAYPVALITLDEEEIAPWAREAGLREDISSLASEPAVRALIQEVLDAANAKYAPVERIKKFAILDHDLSQETGELTPTLKVKRAVVERKHAALLDSLYA